MSDQHQKAKTPPEGEIPLRLEESSEGSTMPVDAGGKDEPASSSASRSAAGASSGGDSPSAASTGGFETTFGKLVVRRGLATNEEVEVCRALLLDSQTGETPRTLGELLIDKEFITQRQFDRLRGDLEAKKSSEQIPGYRIKRKIGAGAMATVFLGRQLSLDRLVAIKVLPKRLSANKNFIERFYKEGRAAAQLNHPNIVGAYDVGRAGDHHFFVMEYVEGETVFDLISRKGRISEPEAIRIVRQVALALQHAHERGFIHRDIKPKNIMITKEGVVKLADLGLARGIGDKETAAAEAGRAYGTPYYISPEQIRGELKIGPAADIYGLGATFYHMVTGRVPFEGKSPSAVMHKHLKADLKPPDHLNPNLSAACAQIIEMMMAKRERDRYHGEPDLIEDLDLVLAGKPPHFAHRGFALPDEEPAPPSASEMAPMIAGPLRPAHSPGFMILVVILTASLLGNLGLLIAILTRTG